MSIPFIPTCIIDDGLRGVLGHEYINSQLIMKLDYEGDKSIAININENKVLIANEIICQYLLRNNLLDIKAKIILNSSDLPGSPKLDKSFDVKEMMSDRNKADKLQQLEEKIVFLEKDIHDLSIATASTQKMVLNNNTFINKSKSMKDFPPLEVNTVVNIIGGTYKGALGRVTKLHDKKVEVVISGEGKTVLIYKTSVSPVVIV